MNPDSAKKMIPRRIELRIDDGFDINWNGGDAYRSQLFNAVSMLFPVGEKWIIDTVRRVVDILPAAEKAAWAGSTRDFIAQESIHSSVHRKYNDHLKHQGLRNWLELRAKRRMEWGGKGTPINQLASSVAYEYLTANLSSSLLCTPRLLEGADARLANVWRWHSAEELEHRHFVLDLYEAAGGGYVRRLLWYVWALSTFMLDLHIQVFLNLRDSRQLFKWSTLGQALRFNFWPGGMFWTISAASVKFLNPTYHHRDDLGDQIARAWLADNAASFRDADKFPDARGS
ncbi:metal-dependent hydrolase [Collimonas humicola]|uniref:metal-dependent hydrolase n=1 Tax=Collimonas humicola TaxID=2825886 RepID=UPI001B8CCEDC|nr:metal-dependent hydrolase [Collimonas humicola]